MPTTKPSYTDCPSKSLIPVSKSKVLAAIPKIRAMVARTQEKEKLREIETAMKEQTVPVKTPWYRLPKSRPMTRPEAEEWVNSTPVDSDGFRETFWQLAGTHWGDLADHLENAASVVEDGGSLWLDLEAANLVAEYQPRD